MDKLKPHLDKLLLAVIFLICATSTVIWVRDDHTPPSWDPSHHLCTAYDYYRPLAHFELRNFANEFFQTRHYYAPLIHLLTAGFFLIFGVSEWSGIAVNFLSLIVLLGSVSWIGRRLYRNAESGEQNPDTLQAARACGMAIGVLAALLSTSYHFTAWLLHDAFLDYPLMAHVTLAFALLIKAGRFQSRSDAVKFAIVAGLGLWTKQTFGFFFILPAIYVSIRVLMTRNWRAIFNLLLAGVIIIAIAAIWYGPHAQDAISIYHINQRAAIDEHEPAILARDSLTYYWHSLISAQMQMPLGILFALGLIYSLVRARKESLILYLWILSGVLTFTFVANKDVRYTVPVLPAAAMLSVCWFREFARHRKQSADAPSLAVPLSRRLKSALPFALAILIAGWALVSFFNAQWPAAGQGTHVDVPYFRWWVFGRDYFIYDHRPKAADWGIPEIVHTVADLPYDESSPSVRAWMNPPPMQPKTPTLDPHEPEKMHAQARISGNGFAWPTLGVVVNQPYLNSSACAWFTRLFATERAGLPILTIESIGNETELAERFGHCDYLLVRTGLDHVDSVQPVELRVEEMIRNHPERFKEVARFPTPVAGCEGVVYQCWR